MGLAAKAGFEYEFYVFRETPASALAKGYRNLTPFSPTTGGYVAKQTFRTGRSTAIFVRKFAGIGGWLSWLFWLSLAFPAALLRELPKGNAGAVLAKYRGFWAGLRERLDPEPRATPSV